MSAVTRLCFEQDALPGTKASTQQLHTIVDSRQHYVIAHYTGLLGAVHSDYLVMQMQLLLVDFHRLCHHVAKSTCWFLQATSGCTVLQCA